MGSIIGAKARRRIRNALTRPFDRTRIPKLMREPVGSGPDFFCIGAQKGGTRWLYDQLQLHPDFWMPPIKELHYFDEEIRVELAEALLNRAREDFAATNESRLKNHHRLLTDSDIDFMESLLWLARRPLDFDSYSRLFNPKGNLIAGDVTPTYSIIRDHKIDAIGKRFGKAKIVYLARDPVERFWSRFGMLARFDNLEPPFTWDQVLTVLRRAGTEAHSSPTRVVSRWRKAFPAESVGVFFFDDLRTGPETLRKEVISFLGGDPAKLSGDIPAGYNRKVSEKKYPMPPEFLPKLVEHFAADLRSCAEEFGGPAAKWPAKYGL